MEPSAMTPVWVVKVLDVAWPRQSQALPHRAFTIGHAFANDVVIRDFAAKGCRVALDLSRGQPARVRILEGQASLLGQTVAPPAEALLPAYVPLALGGVQIAYGEPDSARWEEAWRLVRVVRSDRAENIASADAPPAQSLSLGLSALRRIASYSPLAFGLLSFGFAAFAMSGHFHSVAHASAPSAPVAHVSLRAATNRAQDLCMSLGVAATAVEDRSGLMTLSVPRNIDPSIIDEARRRVLRDNPGLKRVDVAFIDAADDSRQSALNAKRIVEAVAGPAGYLVAADGSKYFAGAQLPMGQVLRSIGPNGVEFEENGLITTINLKNAGN